MTCHFGHNYYITLNAEQHVRYLFSAVQSGRFVTFTLAYMGLCRSASDAVLPKTEDQMAEDGDPTKTQPVKDPPAVLSKALKLIESPDEDW